MQGRAGQGLDEAGRTVGSSVKSSQQGDRWLIQQVIGVLVFTAPRPAPKARPRDDRAALPVNNTPHFRKDLLASEKKILRFELIPPCCCCLGGAGDI